MSHSNLNRLELLYRVSQTFNSSLDLHEVLNRVIDEVIEVTHAERGFLMLVESDGTLSFQTARGLDRQTIEQPKFEVSRSIAQQVAETGEAMLTMNAQSDDRLGGSKSISVLGLRSVLSVPLRLKDKILGVIYVDNRVQVGAFSPDDLDLLAAIASSAVIAIENARLYAVAIEKGRLESELQLARDVQSHFILRQMPTIPGWEFAAAWEPAREVSGDFYDLIPLANGSMGVVIADVSDKGMPAALFMALSRSIMRASAAQGVAAADAVAQANRLICGDAPAGMFVSLCYAELQPSGEVAYVNAGHNPPLVYRPRTGEFAELSRTGIVLGIDGTRTFGQGILRMESGDLILMYTDGLTEALNTQGEEFGTERLRPLIAGCAGLSASALIEQIKHTHQEFTGPVIPFDDVTLMVIKRV